MEDIYEMKYKTGKSGLTFSLAAAGACILIVLVTAFTPVPGLPLAVVALMFTLGCLFVMISGYREITLYHNRMVVTCLLSGTLNEIYYSDIDHIGFLHGASRYQGRLMGRGTSIPVGDLVILTKDGGSRQMFSDDDYDHLHEVCAFIQDKIGHVQ